MKNKRKLAFLALVAAPSLIYAAPTTSASAADIAGQVKLLTYTIILITTTIRFRMLFDLFRILMIQPLHSKRL